MYLSTVKYQNGTISLTQEITPLYIFVPVKKTSTINRKFASITIFKVFTRISKIFYEKLEV